MALKAVVDFLDTVPEPVRELYAEKDGKFHLAVEGLVPAERLNEFRDTNINLAKTVKEMTEKYNGIDPAEWTALQEQKRKIRDKELIDAGKLDELFAERLAPVRAAHEKELGAAREESATFKGQLENLLIDGVIRDAAAKSGVVPTGIPDLLRRGREVFKVVDGKAVPMDGEKVIYGGNGEPKQVGEWIESLTSEAPHLFAPSKGTGAQGNSGNGGSGDGKTITRAAFNALDPVERINAAKTMKIVD